MLFINTRPKDRAASLTNALGAAQVPVIELPLLELVAVPYAESLARLYHQLPQADVIVVVSPTAVHVGMQYLQQAGHTLDDLAHIQWIAVGQTTQTVLQSYGVESHVPMVETSEGMLQLPVLTGMATGSTVAFWRGEGGRLFMMQQLQSLGIHILNFILYQRQCPQSTHQKMHEVIPQLEQTQHYVVLISSEASWLNWLQLLQQHQHLIVRGIYFVLGQRLTHVLNRYAAQQQCLFQVLQLEHLQHDAILRQLVRVQGNA